MNQCQQYCQNAINPKDHHFYYHLEVQKIWKLAKKVPQHGPKDRSDQRTIGKLMGLMDNAIGL